ncbi:MAG: M1 family metallopeptidase [Myxococcales bacterium]|nr:M1 family metallopeptidase [Myxococcales bacterium]
MMTHLIAFTAMHALADDRLQTGVMPLEQRIEIAVDPASPDIEGQVWITLEIPERLQSFELHGEGITVAEATLRRKGRSKRLGATAVAEGSDRLRITSDRPLRPGTWELHLQYTGSVHEQAYGLYRFDHEGRPYLVTQLEADDARTVWPCFDEPIYKIPWKVSVRAPAELAVISNAPVLDVSVEEGSQRVDFDWTPRVPSYAMALAVGPYVGTEVQDVGVPSTIYTVQGKEALSASLAADLPAVVSHIEGWFGLDYPYAKLDWIAVPDFAFGGMENPGAVVIHQGLLAHPSRMTPEKRSTIIRVAAHEVAHMWFGDLVTLAWWDDFWLNESFAEWLGEQTLHAIAPEYRGEVKRVANVVSMVRSDGAATSRPIRTEVDPAAVFQSANFAAYPKGEAILDAVQAWIGPEAFQKGLKRYLQRHAWGNATHSDLFQALEESSGRPVGQVLAGFLDAPGAPALTFTRKDNGKYHVTQRRYAVMGAEVSGGPWQVPLHLRVGRPDGSVVLLDRLVESDDEVLDLGEVAWMHPTGEGFGYLAWSLDDASMEALLQAMPQLDAPERRSLIGSVALQLASGERTAGEVFDALAAFQAETDPALIDALLPILATVKVAENLDDPKLEALMNQWRIARLRPLLDQLGPRPEGGESPDRRRLRRALLSALADAGDREVRKQARGLGKAFLDDPASVDPRLARWGLMVLAEEPPRGMRRMLLKKAEATTDLDLRALYLSAYAAVPGDAARDAALAMALGDDANARDMFMLMGGLGHTRTGDAHEDFMLDWVMENYEAIADKLAPDFRMFLAGSGGGCDRERFERSVGFFSHPDRKVAGTDRVLAETRERVERCILRRERHGADVRTYLEAWADDR